MPNLAQRETVGYVAMRYGMAIRMNYVRKMGFMWNSASTSTTVNR
jgi:hypothetical protein